MTPFSFRSAALGLLIAPAILALGACAEPQENAQLDAANQSYVSASNDPGIILNAQLELQRAKQSLDQAQADWRNGDEPAKIDHEAYLAERQAEIAGQSARYRIAEAQLAQSSQHTQLGSRTERNQATQSGAGE